MFWTSFKILGPSQNAFRPPLVFQAGYEPAYRTRRKIEENVWAPIVQKGWRMTSVQSEYFLLDIVRRGTQNGSCLRRWNGLLRPW